MWLSNKASFYLFVHGMYMTFQNEADPPVPPQARAVLDAEAGCTSLWPWSCITLQNAFILAAMVTLILIGIIALVMVCVSGSEKCRHRVIHQLGKLDS